MDYSKGKIYRIEPICDHDENEIYIGSTTKEYLSQRMSKHKTDYNYWKKGNSKTRISSYNLFDKYGFENCRISLIENVNAKSKDELLARETYYIKTLPCLNKYVSYSTPEDKKINQKARYEKNKEQILAQQQQELICECGAVIHGHKSRHFKSSQHQYFLKSEEEKAKLDEENKLNQERINEKTKTKKKEYYEKNKEEIKAHVKEYYHQNKDLVRKTQNEYRMKNKETISNNRREFYEQNKEKIKERQTKPYECVCGSKICIAEKARHERSKKHQEYLKSNT